MDSHRHARACLEHLDLRPGATLEEIKRAYRTLVQVWHPDRFAKGTAIQFKAEERFKEVSAAYAWLKDNPSYIEELAMGRSGPRDRGAGSGESEAEVKQERSSESEAKQGWFRRRYRAPTYAGRRWIPQVRVPWVFLGALAVGSYIVLRDRDPYNLGVLRPQVFQNVADAIQDPRPENLWVYDQRLDIRRLPGADSDLAGVLARGTRIRATEAANGWRKIVDPASGASLGWVEASNLRSDPPNPMARSASPSPNRTIATAEPEREDRTSVESEIGEVERAPGASVGDPRPPRRSDVSLAPGPWRRTGPLYTEPFDLLPGGHLLVFETRAAGTAKAQVYSVEASRLVAVAHASRVDSGTSRVLFEGGGTFRVRVTATDVPWEARVEVSR